MLSWGEALVKELAARRCIIFFGAGASASCVPRIGTTCVPKWEELLRKLQSRIVAHAHELCLSTELMSEKRYLDAAEVILSVLNRADYVDAMREIFGIPRFQHSKIHEAILNLDPKICMTTNFDTIYDNYCTSGDAHEGYSVFKHTDNHLIAQLRSPIRCIIKVHGCISVPDSMVLTRSEYFAARQAAPHFYRIMDALFLIHTIFFVGYSLSDPDIQLTLENANIAATSSHKHYFVTESGTPPALRRSWEKTFNLEFLEFEKGKYAELEDGLAALAERVDEFRAKHPGI